MISAVKSKENRGISVSHTMHFLKVEVIIAEAAELVNTKLKGNVKFVKIIYMGETMTVCDPA